MCKLINPFISSNWARQLSLHGNLNQIIWRKSWFKTCSRFHLSSMKGRNVARTKLSLFVWSTQVLFLYAGATLSIHCLFQRWILYCPVLVILIKCWLGVTVRENPRIKHGLHWKKYFSSYFPCKQFVNLKL